MELPDLSLLLVIAVFWATFHVLKAFVFKPLGGILREREENVEGARALLQKSLEREHEALEDIERRLVESRREALLLRDAARAEGNAKKQRTLEETREAARVRLQAAQVKLENEIQAARAELRGNTTTLAAEIATATLGRKVA